MNLRIPLPHNRENHADYKCQANVCKSVLIRIIKNNKLGECCDAVDTSRVGLNLSYKNLTYNSEHPTIRRIQVYSLSFHWASNSLNAMPHNISAKRY